VLDRRAEVDVIALGTPEEGFGKRRRELRAASRSSRSRGFAGNQSASALDKSRDPGYRARAGDGPRTPVVGQASGAAAPPTPRSARLVWWRWIPGREAAAGPREKPARHPDPNPDRRALQQTRVDRALFMTRRTRFDRNRHERRVGPLRCRRGGRRHRRGRGDRCRHGRSRHRSRRSGGVLRRSSGRGCEADLSSVFATSPLDQVMAWRTRASALWTRRGPYGYAGAGAVPPVGTPRHESRGGRVLSVRC
jgi:hypothetical protein